MIIKTCWKSQTWVRMAPEPVLEQLQSPGCAHTSPVRFQTQQCWWEGNGRSTHLLKETTIRHHKSISVAYKWPKPQLCSGLGSLGGAVCGASCPEKPIVKNLHCFKSPGSTVFASHKIQLTPHICIILTFHTGKAWTDDLFWKEGDCPYPHEFQQHSENDTPVSVGTTHPL